MTDRRCTGLRADGAPCAARAVRSDDQRCAWHSDSPRARRRSTTPSSRSTDTVRGWLTGPARELLGLTPAEMAERLGVTEEVYASWEADERPMPSRSFTRLIRLLGRDMRTEYVQTVFVPPMEAQKVIADLPNLTRGVPSGGSP